MRDHSDTLAFTPRLPPALERVAFRLRFRGRRLMVEVTHEQTRYTLLEGEPLELTHHGEPIAIAVGAPLARELPAAPQHEAPTQPHGREPRARSSPSLTRTHRP